MQDVLDLNFEKQNKGKGDLSRNPLTWKFNFAPQEAAAQDAHNDPRDELAKLGAKMAAFNRVDKIFLAPDSPSRFKLTEQMEENSGKHSSNW